MLKLAVITDTEDGFMRVANEITDSLLMADLTVRQLKVMLAIMRKTYGFNKPMDRLTNTQIAAMTGIHHTHVCAAKRQLIERKFLIADGVKIGVNKVVSQWISQDSLTLAKTANKTLAKSANGYKPSQLNTKDNIQKTINTNTPLPPNARCFDLEVESSTGVAQYADRLFLSATTDGINYGREQMIEQNEPFVYDKRVLWKRVGRIRKNVGFKLRVITKSPVTLSGAQIRIE